MEHAPEPREIQNLKTKTARQNTCVTVLLVDDEPIVLGVMRMVLAREQYTVLEAKTGQEALQVSDAYGLPIHLLITDHLFQDFTGREIAERIKVSRPDMKVMHVSGYLFDTLPEGSFTPGASFLQKPFTPRNLAEAVRQLIFA
jgi:two-component system cell cycle sensor histidine kinase/response regulator CckA